MSKNSKNVGASNGTGPTTNPQPGPKVSPLEGEIIDKKTPQPIGGSNLAAVQKLAAPLSKPLISLANDSAAKREPFDCKVKAGATEIEGHYNPSTDDGREELSFRVRSPKRG
jgi:hypothetical protein